MTSCCGLPWPHLPGHISGLMAILLGQPLSKQHLTFEKTGTPCTSPSAPSVSGGLPLQSLELITWASRASLTRSMCRMSPSDSASSWLVISTASPSL